MVSFGSILAMIFTITVAFFVPVIAIAVLCAAGRLHWKSVLAGFFLYAVAQTCLRLPALWVFYRIPGAASFAYSPIGNGIVMGVTAALFEEGVRLLGGRFALGRKGRPLTGRDALGYGLGHSVAETFFLMGVSNFSMLMLAFSINNTGLAGYSEMFGQEQAMQVYQTLTGTPAWQFAAGGVERLLYTVIQVAFTALVFYALRRRQWRYLWLAAGAHFTLNFGIALLQPHGVWMGEGYVLVCAVFLAALALPLLRRFWGAETDGPPDGTPVGQPAAGE